jgi:hypothetical protein
MDILAVPSEPEPIGDGPEGAARNSSIAPISLSQSASLIGSAAPARNDRLLALLAEVARWPLQRLAPLRGARRSRPRQHGAPL